MKKTSRDGKSQHYVISEPLLDLALIRSAVKSLHPLLAILLVSTGVIIAGDSHSSQSLNLGTLSDYSHSVTNEQPLYIARRHSRIIASFDQRKSNRESSQDMTMGFTRFLASAVGKDQQKLKSLTAASSNRHPYQKELISIPSHFKGKPISSDILKILLKPKTEPMLAFQGVGFPHIEQGQRNFEQRSNSVYKPYRTLLTIKRSRDGQILPYANVACLGDTIEKTAMKAKRYENSIKRLSAKYGMNPDLVKAVVAKESCFRNKAVSHAGAQGLMQLMPETAKWLGTKDSFNPEQNLRAGIRYLAKLSNQFDSTELVLAAYNAGPGNVRKYGGIPPFKETRDYVNRVLFNYRSFSAQSEFLASAI